MEKPNLSKALLEELQFEAQNTLKLLQAVPNSVLEYRPNDFNWTIAQQCSHIAELYNWWNSILNLDHFELSDYQYDKGDISNIESIIETCKKNIQIAESAINNYPEQKLFDHWRMTMNGKDLFPPSKRIGVIRNFVLSHLYHHRGELVAYLRVNHIVVPGLYGPSYEEMKNEIPEN